jgi:hypothetical protein
MPFSASKMGASSAASSSESLLGLTTWLGLFAIVSLTVMSSLGSSDSSSLQSLPVPKVAGVTTSPCGSRRCSGAKNLTALAAHYATALSWVTRARPDEDAQMFPPERAVTFPAGDGHMLRDGCGTAAERDATLSLRWREAAAAGAPQFPPYPVWNRSLTCAAINGRPVIVLGDSLSAEFYDTLVSSLRRLDAGYADRAPDLRHVVCDGDGEQPSLIQFVSLETVFFEQIFEGYSVMDATVRAAQAEADSHTAHTGAETIWVLNRGVWFRELNVHLELVEDMIQLVRSVAPDATLFWRTTPAGHPDTFGDVAMQNAPPLARPPPAEAFADGLPAQFNWWSIQEQNAATVAALPPDVIVFDVVPATALRHDSHPVRSFEIDGEMRDGLHYCIPGPVDQWVELWAAILRSDL